MYLVIVSIKKILEGSDESKIKII